MTPTSRLALTLCALPSLLLAEGLPVEEIKRNTPVDFTKEIVPFLKQNCFACHNEKKAKADLNLESPAAMKVGGDSGPALVPGDIEESLVFTYAAHLEDDVMPPKKNKANAVDLTPKELGLLKLWIEQGGQGSSASILPGPTEWQPLDHVHSIYAVAISEDGRYAATGRGNRLYVYDLRMGELVAELGDSEHNLKTAHRDFVHTLAFNRDGLLASGGYRSVKLWSVEAVIPTQVSHDLKDVATALTTSPQAEFVVAGDSQGHISMQNLAALEKTQALKVHEGAVHAVLFDPKGQALLSTGVDKQLVRSAFPDKEPIKFALPAEGLSLAALEGGEKIAIGGADNVIRIVPQSALTAGNTPEFVEIKGHTGKVIALAAANAEGTQLASASEDGTVRIWDLAGKQIRQIGHGAPITAFAFDLAGNRLATGDATGMVRLWNAADGKKLLELQGDTDFDVAQQATTRIRDLTKRVADLRKKRMGEREKAWNDLKGKAKGEEDKVAAAKKDLEAKKADADKKQAEADRLNAEIKALEEKKDAGLAKAKEAAKKPLDEAKKAQEALVTAQRNLQNAERSRELNIKDTARAEERFKAAQTSSSQADAQLATAEEAVKAKETEKANLGSGAIKHLAFAPDGKALAVSAEKVALRLWSTATGLSLDTLRKEGTPTGVSYGATGKLVAALPDKNIVAWTKTKQWNKVRQIGDGITGEPFPDRVLAVAFDPSGQLLATGSGIPSRSGELRFWNVADGAPKGEIKKAHLDTITALSFSPEGDRIVSSSTDRYLKIHQVESKELIDQLEGHTNHVLDVAWSADGETLGSAGADHVAKLWTIESGKQKKTEGGFKKEITALAFLGDTETLVIGGGDKIVKSGGQNLPSVDDFVYDVASSADGATILAGGDLGVLRVWTAADRKLLFSFPSPTEKPDPETAAK